MCNNSMYPMNKYFYRHYIPAHSNLIIHWTGIDIDDPCWCSHHDSNTNDSVTEKYLDRLKSILKYGLWMTKNEEDQHVIINNQKIERPWFAMTCFTELKLSEVRNHAAKYGRLGIGFKRRFLFDRLGSPMMYYHQENEPNWFFLPHTINNKFKKDDFFLCFLKPMKKENSKEFEYFDESEWRIIYSDMIDKYLKDNNKGNIAKNFKNLTDIEDREFSNYLKKCKKRPEYLIPIKDSGQWFAIIIYPSINAKVASERDAEIRNLIREIKPDAGENYIKESANCEKFSKPIEIDLDACRNF